MIIPYSVYAQNTTTTGNSNSTIIIKAEVQESQEIKELLKQITERQQVQDDKFNQLIDELNKKQFSVEQTKDSTWGHGDLITASATIIAFFGFGALLTIRFTTRKKNALVESLKGILAASFGIQFIHLILILVIIVNAYSTFLMVAVIGLTIIFLSFIVMNTRELFELEYLASTKKTELDIAGANALKKRSRSRLKRDSDTKQLKVDETEENK